jgi:hypothetical protein
MQRTHLRPPRTLAVAAAVGALAAPTASAAPVEQVLPSAREDTSERVAPVRVVQVGADQGFDWGDAGIGASGLLALMAIGAGAALATGRRVSIGHDPQPVR